MKIIDGVCEVSHIELAYHKHKEWWSEELQISKIKCCNRLCYNNKLRDSDYCIEHHLRDECPTLLKQDSVM